MPDSKIDPLDIGALERSVNDSATRVSAIWLSFVAFTAYIAATVANISHRQIFLEEPVKLPTINIDLPLVASSILLPLLFVIYHVYVLLQVVLLARTAAAYNQALERGVPDPQDSTHLRQRLANTLFAQLFAGSPREREGVLGGLLRLMAWITLAIAPVLALLAFEIRFLPYHSAVVTWSHRALVAIDLVAVLLLWAAAVDVRRDIAWRFLYRDWRTAVGAAAIIILTCGLLTFPGEPGRAWMRLFVSDSPNRKDVTDCRLPSFIEDIVPTAFDRLVLPNEDAVDDDKLAKIVAVSKANDQNAYESERTRNFRLRDLRCGRFPGADLRRVDFAGADLSGAILRAARLEGASFSGAKLHAAILDSAQLQGATFAKSDRFDGSFDVAEAPDVSLRGARLDDANFDSAQLRGATLVGAVLTGASFNNTRLAGAALGSVRAEGTSFYEAKMQGAFLIGARLQGAVFDHTELQGAMISQARMQGASLRHAQLQGAIFRNAYLEGADLYRAALQGAVLDGTRLDGAFLVEAQLQGARLQGSPLRFAVLDRTHLWRNDFRGRCEDALVREPQFEAIAAVTYPRKNEYVLKIAAAAGEAHPYLDRITREVPEKGHRPEQSRYRVRADLGARLSDGAPSGNAARAEPQWTACAKRFEAPDFDAEEFAGAFSEFLCELEAEQTPIVVGIARNWAGKEAPKTAVGALLATRLINLRTACPRAPELKEDARLALCNALETKPPACPKEPDNRR